MKEIYEQFKITANLTQEIANVKINEIAAAVKAIHDNRMMQQAQVAQQTQSNALFNMPQAQ